MRATSSRHRRQPDPPRGWPGKPGLDLQYGYGRPNVCKAMQAVRRRRHPAGRPGSTRPTGTRSTTRPRPRRVPVTGHVEAPRSQPLHVEAPVRAGRRARPTRDFITAASGSGSGPIDGSLGTHRPEPGPAVVLGRRPLHALERQGAGDERAVHGHPAAPGDRRERPGRRGAAHDRRPPRPEPAGRASRSGSGRAARAQPALADLQGTGRAGDRSSATPTAASTPSTRDGDASCPAGPVHTDPTQVTESAHRGRPGPRADPDRRRGRRPGRTTGVSRSSPPPPPGASTSGTRRASAARAGRRRSTPGSQQPPIPRPDAAVHPPADSRARPPARCSPTSTATARSRSSRRAGTATSTPGSATAPTCPAGR